MTLVKLKLNLKTTDLAFRFGVSNSVVSRYITTWICFIYHHIKELEWMLSVDQVKGTLPVAFHEKFPNTFAIIDGSEIFVETPSDLQMQSSTWSINTIIVLSSWWNALQMVQFHMCLHY